MSEAQMIERITAQIRVDVQRLLRSSRGWKEGQRLREAEASIRVLVRQWGCHLAEGVLAMEGGGHVGSVHVDEQGQVRKFKEYRERRVVMTFGEVKYRRARYESKEADPCGYYPLDRKLGVRGQYSELMEELMAYGAAQQTYEATAGVLEKTLGVQVVAATVQHVARRWGQEGLRRQQEGRGLVPRKPSLRMAITVDGGKLRVSERRRKRRGSRKQHFLNSWREAKLGAIYGFDRRGEAEGERWYAASIEGKDTFAQRLWEQIESSGADRAPQTVWLGDGAAWIWDLKAEILPQAVEILDYYHARDHLYQMAHALWGECAERAQQWAEQQSERLREGQALQVIAELKRLSRRYGQPPKDCSEQDRRKVLADNVHYFQSNLARMDYKQYREQGFMIGSGMVESGCRHVIGHRMKITGSMSWSAVGAEGLLQLRCLVRSHHWDQFWRLQASAI